MTISMVADSIIALAVEADVDVYDVLYDVKDNDGMHTGSELYDAIRGAFSTSEEFDILLAEVRHRLGDDI